ncbi:nucleotide exchange factor GrpE [Ectothiorhodospiraceae bacterium BW-2]|nr:nucleotide exchange factor GrpE [Ectothiorhodospiraceae bacterium BW-2]
MKEEFNQLQQQNETLKEQLLRAHAELENGHRRSQQAIAKAHKFALEKFATELLPVVDSLEMGLNAMSDAEQNEVVAKLHEGTEMTLKLFLATLEKFDIKAVGEPGESFNPDYHQAVSMQPSAEYPANSIAVVMQKGYLLNERLIRPAMVMVSQGSAS